MYTQYLAITYKGKEPEKEYIYIYVCVCVCVCVCVLYVTEFTYMYTKLNHFSVHWNKLLTNYTSVLKNGKSPRSAGLLWNLREICIVKTHGRLESGLLPSCSPNSTNKPEMEKAEPEWPRFSSGAAFARRQRGSSWHRARPKLDVAPESPPSLSHS